MLVLLASLLVGCSAFPPPNSPGLSSEGYQLDPIFGGMYKGKGGTARFGRPISNAQFTDVVTTQYVENGKLVFDQSKPQREKFSLAPLGREMVMEEPPVPEPKDPQIPYKNGHTILPEFYALYKELDPSLVGKPLTEPRHNIIRLRTEQFFENLGFYMIDGTTDVRLLAYGVWGCKDGCQAEKGDDHAIIDIQSYIDPLFKDYVTEAGVDFTGFALTGLYQTQEGLWEQILENIVLQADSREKPTQIGSRPIVRELGIQPEEPRQPSNLLGAFFFRTRGDNEGYDIQYPYWEYISAKNKNLIELTGAPISHNSKFDALTYHQCFENVCLWYDPNAAEGARVRPEPLGYAYKQMFYPARAVQFAEPTVTVQPPTITAPPLQTPPARGKKREISLRLWESFQTLEKKQNQEIQVWVLENNQPVVGGVVLLTVALPNSGDAEYEMPPTDENGQSSLTLPKIKAANGVIVPYSACYSASAELNVCVKDSFVIWDNP